MMRICFFWEGKRICIPIYLLVRKLIPEWWWSGAPTEPSPWRWIEHPDIRDEVAKEMATIALIDQLAGSLSAERSKAIQSAVRATIREGDLAKGVTVSFDR
jgi:hypothetical protein